MSRFLLVIIAEDLEPLKTTRGGLFAGIKCVNGVESVTDLSVISPQTLESWMLPRQMAFEFNKNGKKKH